jgi:hypothetical protein
MTKMKRALRILELIGITILAFLLFLLVWSPMVLLMFIFGMIGLFITPWLGYILLIAFSILIILKFIIDLLNENGTL